jgi:hypothetical protein
MPKKSLTVQKTNTRPSAKPALSIPELPMLQRMPSYEQWCDYGHTLKNFEIQLGKATDDFRVIVSNWYEFGTQEWNHTAQKIAREIGFDAETIQNWAWAVRNTSKLIEAMPSLRGDENTITFAHRQKLAAVKDVKQQIDFAKKAQAGGWSARRLEREIQSSKNESQPDDLIDHKSPLEHLIADLCAEGAELLGRDDEVSRAQGDVKMDCAARLREIFSK